jgi:hypothetical protein
LSVCFGADYTQLSSDMLLPSDLKPMAANEKGRRPFLLPNKYQLTPVGLGNSILSLEAKNLFEPNDVSRTSTGSDGITDTYLRALEVVGDVVAHNCDFNNPYCQCNTAESAKSMMKRCLPNLSPEGTAMIEATNVLFETCKSDKLEDRRKAISSLIGSYAFAAAR